MTSALTPENFVGLLEYQSFKEIDGSGASFALEASEHCVNQTSCGVIRLTNDLPLGQLPVAACIH